MLTCCLQLDLRRQPEATRPELGPGEALLVVSRAVPSPLPGRQSWTLVDGPSAYLWVEHAPLASQGQLSQRSQRQHGFLRDYKALLARCLAGERSALEAAVAYRQELRAHLDDEESHLYPVLTEFLQHDRCARELGYEHQGIRRYLDEWLLFLEVCLAGGASKRDVDQFEMKLFHLMEHHFAREDRAVFPLLERVQAFSDGNLTFG